MGVEDLHQLGDLLGIDFLGAIPESPAVLQSSNAGKPVVMDGDSDAAKAYDDILRRFLGEDVPHRFLEAQKKGFFSRMFGGGASSEPLAATG